jgi:dihydroflavonol-4-reductase
MDDPVGAARPILVTGGAGFIGSHVVRLLANDGCAVRVFDLPEADADHLHRRNVQFVAGDLRRLDDLKRAMTGCGLVIHLAANPNLYARDAREFHDLNYLGTDNVLAAARALTTARVVHVSSESILTSNNRRHPIDEQTMPSMSDMIGPYCRSKWEAEMAAMAAAKEGMGVVVASPTVPAGPGDRRRGPLSRLICQFAQGKIKACLEGQINILDVRDAAAGIIAAAQHGSPGRRYLLAGENWSVSELFYALAAITGRPAPRWRVPYAAALSFAWLEEKYCRHVSGKTPMASVTGVRLTRRCFRFDGSATAAELGLHPRPVIEALRDAVRWFQQTKAIDPTPAAADLSLAAEREG